MDQVSTVVAHWVVGALIGVTFALTPSLLPLSAAALVTFVVAVLALRGQARFALTGGAGTTLGLLFLYLTQRSIESCAQFNRQPGGRCEMGDSTPFIVIALLFLLAGLALSLLALRRPAR